MLSTIYIAKFDYVLKVSKKLFKACKHILLRFLKGIFEIFLLDSSVFVEGIFHTERID